MPVSPASLHGKSAAPSVWQRLENPVILETEEVAQPDGSVKRTRLVQVAGKYPFVIFEGTLPAGNAGGSDNDLRSSVAKVADHVIVRPRDGVSEAEFQEAVSRAGLKVGARLSPDGPYLVLLPKPSIHGPDQAIGALKGDAFAYAEPDFLVNATDIPADRIAVDQVDGKAIYPDAALDAFTIRPPDGPVFDAATRAAHNQERMENLPAGARLLTFDAPTFLGGPSSYNPYLEEQNFLVSTDTGAYVQNAYTTGYPNNGTYYVRSLSSETNFTIRHREGLPFTILKIDLAEYSSLFASPKSVTFVGYKAAGGTVSQTFLTDGMMDGTGPLDDFQTFSFNASFTGLTKVMVTTTAFMVDNIALVVEGQETQPPAPPAPPLIYDVTWDAPKHTVNQLTAVAGPYAPSSINFGTPTVRTQVGTLAGPALELTGSGYQQLRFGLPKNAQSYRLEFDTFLGAPLSLHFDGAGGVQRVDFSGGYITIYQSGLTPGIPTVGYSTKRTTKIAVNVDMIKAQWEVFVDGVRSYIGRFDVSTGDVTDIRFHSSGSSTAVGIDNVRIYAYGVDDAPATGPKLYVSPPSFSFPTQPIGSSKVWSLGLYNKGGQTLTVQGISSTDSQFRVIGTFPLSIIPGGFFYVNVDFQPTTVGAISGNLIVASNDPAAPSVTVPVTGGGSGVPQLSVNPANLFVTMLANRIGTQNFTLSNPGAAPLKWNLVLKGVATSGGAPTDPSRLPSDAYFASLWAMASPRPGLGGIDAVHAWSVTTGSASNVIAVIDTGVDRTHPDLQGNLWTNAGEIAGNGLDDDHNGYIDDVNGWDFAGGDADPSDVYGHGTHVAGTIAARGNNSLGVAGVSWNARLMAVKFLSDKGSGYTSDAISAVSYATRMGARLSNNSWGGGGYSQALADVIQAAGQAGSLFIAAAGNANSNNDLTPQYPASYTLDNIVAVGATDGLDLLSYFSNYGVISVDLGAPGTNILSLRPGGEYAYLSGTSMATPHVTGAAGLLLSQNPTLTPAKVKQLLMFGSDSLASLGNRVGSQGRLNAYRTLKATVPSWLLPQITSGTVPAGESVLVPLTVNTTSLPTGIYNQVIALTSNDPIRPNVDLPVELKIAAPSGYNQWLVGAFTGNEMLANTAESTVWSDTADPDGDGISNLFEFMAGGNPLISEPRLAPAVVQQDGDALFEFRVRDSSEGLSWSVEWTPSLESPQWQSTGIDTVENTTAGMPAGIRRLRIKLASRQSTAFFRLVGSRSL